MGANDFTYSTQWADRFAIYSAPFFGMYPTTNNGPPAVQQPVGNDVRTTPWGMFQIQPDPWQSACNTPGPTSPHAGFINVLAGDGSVRPCAQGMSPNVWWMAMVADDGNTAGDGW